MEIKIYQNGNKKTVAADCGNLISSVLELSNSHIDYPCAKKGICKKCLVKAKGQLSEPTAKEQELGELLSQGYRLACMTKILGDCEITLPSENQILQTADNEIKLNIKQSSPMFEKYGLAVDIGTTTISASLLQGDKVTTTESIKNPQISFGADVISRIEQQLAGLGEELSQSVVGGLNHLIEKLCENLSISYIDIDACVITGNTVMLHLLTKRDCKKLSVAPFIADYLGDENIKAEDFGLNLSNDCHIYLPTCISAFVGADITTAILASEITSQNKTSILVDIGTNGEMALWQNGKLSCCSTAAGPAFEGVGIKHGMYGVSGAIETVKLENDEIIVNVIGETKAKGICGSGVVDAVATMLDLEIIDETGYMEEVDEFTDRFIDDEDLSFILSDDIGITSKDVRAIQLAKSAICAGLVTLIKESKLTFNDIDALYIAGGFGSYLNMVNAGKIGLIPNELVGKVKLLGNAALSGAQMILLNKNLSQDLKSYSKNTSLIDLATSENFMNAYMDNMFFTL